MDGRASRAPYSVRKLEASLLKEHRPDEVVVAHEDYIEEFIDEESEVYPEVARMGLLDFSVSAIMQQHQEVTDGLARMEATMAKDDWAGAR
jgi:hypothetical protein